MGTNNWYVKSSAFLKRPQKFALNVQTMRKLVQIFVAFSEKLNFRNKLKKIPDLVHDLKQFLLRQNLVSLAEHGL